MRARIGRKREKLQNTFSLTNLSVRVEAKSISRKQNDTTTLVISNCSGEENKEVNLHYKNRQPELFLLFKHGLREREKERKGEQLSSRERTNIKSGEDLHVLVSGKLNKQKHTHTPTQL